MSLRALIESDLETTLENANDFGMEVSIQKVVDGVAQVLSGRVVYAYEDVDAESGEPVIINQPMVTLRLSSMTTVPEDGDAWYFDIPESPVEGATTKRYVFDKNVARRGSKSIGFLSYPLKSYEDMTT